MSSKLHMFSYMKSNFQGYSRAHERVSWMLHPNGGTSAMGHDVLFPGSFRWVKSDLYMLRMRIFHLCASPRRYHNAKFTQFRCVPTTAPPQELLKWSHHHSFTKLAFSKGQSDPNRETPMLYDALRPIRKTNRGRKICPVQSCQVLHWWICPCQKWTRAVGCLCRKPFHGCLGFVDRSVLGQANLGGR